MATWDPIEGEAPIDPSHLKDKSIKTREQLKADTGDFSELIYLHRKYLDE